MIKNMRQMKSVSSLSERKVMDYNLGDVVRTKKQHP